MDVSAMHGHLGMLKWLTENRTEGCSTNAMDWAAKEGKLVRTYVRSVPMRPGEHIPFSLSYKYLCLAGNASCS